MEIFLFLNCVLELLIISSIRNQNSKVRSLETYKKAEKNIGYEISKKDDSGFAYTKTVFETASDDTTAKLTVLIIVIGAIFLLVRKK